ncbi:MAG TPA: hypothetical protein VNJ04_12070 [Gemmatimonadaceae bacterium]|nr:hypothetical protein [Gemmatimonadaceae bacterium]
MGWFQEQGIDVGEPVPDSYDPGTASQAPPEDTPAAPTSGGYSGRNAAYADAIQQAYRQHLGRDGSQAEIQSHLDDPNFNISTKVRQIEGSGEAGQYRQRTPAPTTPAPSAPAAASGFDARQQVGHDGKTSSGMTREQYRDAWQGSGARSMADLEQFVKQNGGSVVSGNGTVRTPYGEDIDMLIGARTNGNGRAGWGGVGGGGSAPTNAAAPPSAPAPATYAPSGGGYGGGGGNYGGGGSYSGASNYSARGNDSGGGNAGGGDASFYMPPPEVRPTPTYMAPPERGVEGPSGGWDGRWDSLPVETEGYGGPGMAGRPVERDAYGGDGPTYMPPPDRGGQDELAGLPVQPEGYGSVAAPAPLTGLTADELRADPSYQFRFAEGQRALETSAAGRGMIRHPNTMRELVGYGQDAASQEYGAAYGRKANTYAANTGTQLNVAGLNLQNRQTSNAYALGRGNLALQGRQTSNAYELGRGNLELGRGNLDVQRRQTANAYELGRGNLDVQRRQTTNAYELGRGNLDVQRRQTSNAYELGRGNLDMQGRQTTNAYELGRGNLALGYRAADQNYNLGNRNVDLGYTNAGNNYSLGNRNVDLGYTNAANNHSLGMANVGLGYQQANNSYGLGMANVGLGYGNLGLAREGQTFNQGYSMANLGLTAAELQARYGGQYAGNAGGLYTGQGNANAAGRVGAGNAWAGAFSNIGRDAISAVDRYGRRNGE